MKKLFSLLMILFIASAVFAQDATKLFERKGYYVQSALNYGKDQGGYWDFPGELKKVPKGKNLQIWDFDNNRDRIFYIMPSDKEGFYEICPAWTKDIRLDVQGGAPNMNKNGANIASWSKNNADWQKFRFKHLGNGKFKIYTTSGMVVCIAGRESKNGINVHLWNDHDGAWMEWYLIDPSTKKPFVPVELPEYSNTKPDFFRLNKKKTFKFKVDLAFVEGSEGTAKVISVNKKQVKLSITATQRNQSNGKMETKTYEKTLNFKDGEYSDGKWDCMECAKGKAKIYPDGRQMLSMNGDQYGLTFTVID